MKFMGQEVREVGQHGYVTVQADGLSEIVEHARAARIRVLGWRRGPLRRKGAMAYEIKIMVS